MGALEAKSSDYFQKWYQEHKTELSQKRKKRYREDPAYRKAAVERSRKSRQGKAEPVINGFTLSFADMATRLGITIWTLREWRRKDYFPEPHHRQGRLWFNEAQAQLLQKLQAFFVSHGIRMNEGKRGQLNELTALIYANWA